MRIKSYLGVATLVAGLLLALSPSRLIAQNAGTVDFSAHVAATGGRPEPVRQLTFYLLSKSLDDIRTEAERLEHTPDLAQFVDTLSVSPELKAWMKKHHTVQLVGSDFTKSLTADDILDTPEFFDAFMMRNAGFKSVGFPDPKFKEKDRESNPEKYNRQKAEYKTALHKFIDGVPESVQGIDLNLTDTNPYEKWQQLVSSQKQRLDDRTFDLAQQRYLAGQADTDLEGHGSFANVRPGTYWIGMIGMQAMSGDVRIRWDLPLTVRSGETTRVELTNRNALKSYQAAQDSNR